MRRALLAALVLTWTALSAAAQHGATAHWEYEGPNGPAHWGTLDHAYEMCVAGKHQSPIDIRNARTADLPAINFAYRPTPLKVIDNGHTIQMIYAPGSFITVGNEKYELQQFHFHHPAEEKLSGKPYPMVAHLVHKNGAGKLAVVAVLLTEGHANALVENLWKNLPAERGQEITKESVSVDASKLLPTAHGYFTFDGSLTTPPCTEGVTWFVLKTPVALSKGEIDAFAKKYPHNARPVQALNGRLVQETK